MSRRGRQAARSEVQDTLIYTIVAETPTEQLLAIASELGGQEPRRN